MSIRLLLGSALALPLLIGCTTPDTSQSEPAMAPPADTAPVAARADHDEEVPRGSSLRSFAVTIFRADSAAIPSAANLGSQQVVIVQDTRDPNAPRFRTPSLMVRNMALEGDLLRADLQVIDQTEGLVGAVERAAPELAGLGSWPRARLENGLLARLHVNSQPVGEPIRVELGGRATISCYFELPDRWLTTKLGQRYLDSEELRRRATTIHISGAVVAGLVRYDVEFTASVRSLVDEHLKEFVQAVRREVDARGKTMPQLLILGGGDVVARAELVSRKSGEFTVGVLRAQGAPAEAIERVRAKGFDLLRDVDLLRVVAEAARATSQPGADVLVCFGGLRARGPLANIRRLAEEVTSSADEATLDRRSRDLGVDLTVEKGGIADAAAAAAGGAGAVTGQLKASFKDKREVLDFVRKALDRTIQLEANDILTIPLDLTQDTALGRKVASHFNTRLYEASVKSASIPLAYELTYDPRAVAWPCSTPRTADSIRLADQTTTVLVAANELPPGATLALHVRANVGMGSPYPPYSICPKDKDRECRADVWVSGVHTTSFPKGFNPSGSLGSIDHPVRLVVGVDGRVELSARADCHWFNHDARVGAVLEAVNIGLASVTVDEWSVMVRK